MIESKENKKIKYVNKLRHLKFMEKEKKFIIEGKHLVMEAKKEGVLLETFSTDDTSYGVLNNVVSDEIMKYISTLPSFTSVLGVCKYLEEKTNLGDKIIILDNVQDPGNLGTIIRSAKAFNIDTIVLSNNCVSKYNEKVIRATQGMLFKVNVIKKNLKEIIDYLYNNDYKVYATNPNEGTLINDVNLNGKVAIIMGNEGVGISSYVKQNVKNHIMIKMNDDCESLNVSVATSIIMYEMSKGK